MYFSLDLQESTHILELEWENSFIPRTAITPAASTGHFYC